MTTLPLGAGAKMSSESETLLPASCIVCSQTGEVSSYEDFLERRQPEPSRTMASAEYQWLIFVIRVADEAVLGFLFYFISDGYSLWGPDTHPREKTH